MWCCEAAYHPNDYFMYVATEDSTYITVDGTTILTNGGPGDAGTYSMTGMPIRQKAFCD